MKISIDLDNLCIDEQSVAEYIRDEMRREIQILVRGVVRESRKELRALVEKAAKETVEAFKKGKLKQVAQAIGTEFGS